LISLGEHIFQIPWGDRWRIYHRLQELMISSTCLSDGSLQVTINSFSEGLLVYSTLMQVMATRSQLVVWLEVCWELRTSQ